MKLNFIKKYTGVILLSVTLIIGILTFKNYGISWDEQTQREIGQISYNYIFHHDNALLSYGNNCYGVVYEVSLVILGKNSELKGQP